MIRGSVLGGDWPRQLMSSMPGFSIRSLRDACTTGEFRLDNLGGMQTAEIRSSPVRAEWRPEASPQEAHQIKVVFQLSGEGFAGQGGRELHARPGDFFLLQGSQPYWLGFEEDFHQLSVELPREHLAGRIACLSDVTALVLDGSQGAPRFLQQFVCSLICSAEPEDARVAHRLRQHVVELLQTALQDLTVSTNPTQKRRLEQLQRIQTRILDNLDDPDLDVSKIACSVGVSVRTLYSLFDLEDISVARWIRIQRIQRCRLALSDPHQSARTVSEIAFSHGFNDPAHFSTLFRATTGMSPSEYRRSQIESAVQAPA